MRVYFIAEKPLFLYARLQLVHYRQVLLIPHLIPETFHNSPSFFRHLAPPCPLVRRTSVAICPSSTRSAYFCECWMSTPTVLAIVATIFAGNDSSQRFGETSRRQDCAQHLLQGQVRQVWDLHRRNPRNVHGELLDDTYPKWVEVEQLSTVITKEEAARNDYNLSPS